MPRIVSALHHKGRKLPTRDKKKWQRTFDHDPDVMTREKLHAAVKSLSNAKPKPFSQIIPPELVDLAHELGMDVEGNLTTGKWADETEFDTSQYEKD